MDKMIKKPGLFVGIFLFILIICFLPLINSQCLVKAEIFNKGKENPNGLGYLDLKILEILNKDHCPIKLNNLYRASGNFSETFKKGKNIEISVKETESEKKFTPHLVWKNITYKNETKEISLIGSSIPISELESNALTEEKYKPLSEEKEKIKNYIYIIVSLILFIAIVYLIRFILKRGLNKKQKPGYKVPYNILNIEKNK